MKQESQEAQSTKASVKRKRTSKKKPKGLGDVVESVAKATGVAKLVEAVVGDCGCEKRKIALNRRFPFLTLMNDSQKKQWEDTLRPAYKQGQLTLVNQKAALKLYEHIFKIRHKLSRCGSCVNQKLADLEAAYLASCEDSTTQTKPE